MRTEQLQKKSQITWVNAMNNILNRAKETVNPEIINI
ncbi:MAG: TnpV protein [[Clostridium] spiroforme]|uniref:TnpV protein n=1 Tax=Thomasclavelia spiroformis TaxID=29348 RepID=A0A943EKV4_9FIRM|nr:TnpV protein [Thomasclavelia spiroformis]